MDGDLELPKECLTASEIAMIIEGHLKTDSTLKRYELEVIRDRQEIILTDPYGSLYKVEVIDCE